MKWGVVDEENHPLLFVELSRPPECEMYEFEEHHPSGRSALLATFFGPNAMVRAGDWITSVELPRLLRSRQNELGPEEDKPLPVRNDSTVSEVSNGTKKLLAG
jgi:hypothetical protein